MLNITLNIQIEFVSQSVYARLSELHLLNLKILHISFLLFIKSFIQHEISEMNFFKDKVIKPDSEVVEEENAPSAEEIENDSAKKVEDDSAEEKSGRREELNELGQCRSRKLCRLHA